MNRVFITGDIHGNHLSVADIINRINNPTEDDYIIICGDAGLEYGSYISQSTKMIMNSFPGYWIVMRGNHDTRYWRDHVTHGAPHEGWSIIDDYLIENIYPHICYIKDEGGLYNIGYWHFLFIPGAYSVDKNYRLRYCLPYEREEQLTYFEQHKLFNLVDDSNNCIDFIIAHTFPEKTQVYYKDLFINEIDQSKVDKTTEEFLDEIMKIIEEKHPEFKHYFGGHFHDDRELTDKYTMLYYDIVEASDYGK